MAQEEASHVGVVAIRAWLILCAVAGPAHAELCSYRGETSYRGHVTVQTLATQAAGMLTLHVTARLDATPWHLWSIEFLAEEISTWRAGVLEGVAVNGRYLSDGAIKRQQWDVFAPAGGALEARRMQAKRQSDFTKRYPAFAAVWPIAAFGAPWLSAFHAAPSERRPDLDLPAAARVPGLRTPMALAFYWSRFMPDGESAVPVFLPGWKRDALVTESVAGGGGMWRMELRHPTLSGPSWAEATVAGHVLRRVRFEAHSTYGDGTGAVDLLGCSE